MANKIKIDVEVNGKMQKATVSAKKLKAALDGANSSQDRLNANTRTYDRRTKGAAQATSNSTKEFSKMSQGMGGLVGAYATVAASVFALSAAFQFMQRVGDMSALTSGQEMMASRTGVSMKLLSTDLQRATAGMVAFKDAAQAAAIGNAAGLTSDQLQRLGTVAKNAGTILGRDVTDSFNRLTRGAIKAEPELLDELGIIVRIKDASEEYAKTIGKNAKDLTTFEKSQAVVNAVLAQGETKFDDVGDSVNKVTQLGAKFQDMLKDLGQTIAPVVNFLAGSFASNVQALAAGFGVIGIAIVKSLLPVAPQIVRTEKDIAKSRKRIQKSLNATPMGKKIKAQLKNQEKLTKNHLRILENAYNAKNSKVVNYSKITKQQLKADLQAIRLETLQTTKANQNAFNGFFTQLRIDMLNFEMEYGKTMGRLVGMASMVGRAVGMIFSVISFVGIGVMLAQIGKDLYDKFFRDQEIVALEKKVKELTKAFEEQLEEINEVEEGLKKARSPAEDLAQTLGLISNFSYTGIKGFLKDLEEFDPTKLDAAVEAFRKLETGDDTFRSVGSSGILPVPDFLNTDVLDGSESVSRVRELGDELAKLNKKGEDEAWYMTLSEWTLGFGGVGKEVQKTKMQINDLKTQMQGTEAGEALKFLDSKEMDMIRKKAEGLEGALPNLQRNIDLLQKAGIEGSSNLGLGTLKEDLTTIRESDDPTAIAEALERVREGYTGVLDEVETLNTKSVAVNNAFGQMTNAAQAFQDAGDKILPPESKFTAFYGAIFDANGAIDTLTKNIEGLSDKTSIEDFFKVDGAGKETEQGQAILRLMKLVNVTEEEGLTLLDLKNKLRDREAEILANEKAMLDDINNEKIRQLNAQEGIAKHEKDFHKALNGAAEAQIGLNSIQSEYENMQLTNVVLSAQQKEDYERKIALAQAEADEAARLLGIELQLLAVKKEEDAAQFELKILGYQKQVTDQLNKELKLRQDIQKTQESIEKKQLKLAVGQAGRNNAFFNEDKAMAQGNLAIEQEQYKNKQALIEEERQMKKDQIDSEYTLLEAKLRLQKAQMTITAIELENTKDKTAQAQAQELRASIADIDLLANTDLAAGQELAHTLIDLQQDEKLVDLDLALLQSQRIADNFESSKVLMETVAGATETLLQDSFMAFFDSIEDSSKNLKDSLKDIARSFVKTLQKEMINQFFVQPIMDWLGGLMGKVTPAQKIARAHQQGAAATAKAINTAGGKAGSQGSPGTGVAGEIQKALDVGGQQLKQNIIDALNTKIHVCCCDRGSDDQGIDPNLLQAAGNAISDIIISETSGKEERDYDGDLPLPNDKKSIIPDETTKATKGFFQTLKEGIMGTREEVYFLTQDVEALGKAGDVLKISDKTVPGVSIAEGDVFAAENANLGDPGTISTGMTGFFDKISNFFSTLFAKGGQLGTTISTFFGDLFSKGGQLFSTIGQSFSSFFSTLFSKQGGAGGAGGGGILSSIMGAFGMGGGEGGEGGGFLSSIMSMFGGGSGGGAGGGGILSSIMGMFSGGGMGGMGGNLIGMYNMFKGGGGLRDLIGLKPKEKEYKDIEHPLIRPMTDLVNINNETLFVLQQMQRQSGMMGGMMGGMGGMGGMMSGMGGGGGMGSLISMGMSMFGFKNGGIMSNGSKIAGYAEGGIAKGPKKGHPAMLHGTEAIVPLPNNKSIPVDLQNAGGQTQNNVAVNVSVANDGQAQSQVQSEDGAANLGKVISSVVTAELQKQKRPGGLLSPVGAT